jgi:hypothetical protein
MSNVFEIRGEGDAKRIVERRGDARMVTPGGGRIAGAPECSDDALEVVGSGNDGAHGEYG